MEGLDELDDRRIGNLGNTRHRYVVMYSRISRCACTSRVYGNYGMLIQRPKQVFSIFFFMINNYVISFFAMSMIYVLCSTCFFLNSFASSASSGSQTQR